MSNWPPIRLCLVQDNSCHWYIIPAGRRDEWDTWLEIPEDDERSWIAPAFAKAVGGSPSSVTFTDAR